MFEAKWTLRPIKTGESHGKIYYDQIMILHNDYPLAIMHIDSWWECKAGANEIYKQLLSGLETIVSVTMTIEDANDDEHTIHN